MTDPAAKGLPTGRSPEVRLARDRRRAQVAILTLSGQTQEQIADQLGASRRTIGNDQQAIRQQWRKTATASYEDHVTRVVGYLEALLSRSLPAALRVTADGQISARAHEVALGALDRYMTLLGLAKPAKPAPLAITVEGRVTHEHLDARTLAGALAALGEAGILDRVAATGRASGAGGGAHAEVVELHPDRPDR